MTSFSLWRHSLLSWPSRPLRTYVRTYVRTDVRTLTAFKRCLMCPPFRCKTHSIGYYITVYRCLTADACDTFCHASLHIKSPTRTKFAAVQADRGWPVSSRISIQCWFPSATSPYWLCSTSCVEIIVAVVESEIRVADFRQVAPLVVINLTIDTTSEQMCSEKTSLKCAKVMRIGAGVLKVRAAKRSGLGVLRHPVGLPLCCRRGVLLCLRVTSCTIGLYTT